MGAYLAVIKDSFREALASRVLWILLVVITFVLILLAPFGYTEKATTRLGDGDVENFGDFIARVQAAGEVEDKSPSRRIWEKLSEKQREDIGKFQPGKNPDGIGMARAANRFVRRVNELIDSDDFYDAEYWETTPIYSSEGRDLIKRMEDGETLTTLEQSRLNRLALEAAFPDVVKSGFPTSLQFRYLWYDLGPTLPMSRRSFNSETTEYAAFVMKWFVGVVGVVIAILITASVIPQMFDPGSLHLLLSFPVSRSLLFLAKYIGGCAFTFLSAAYLIGGLWFLLGIRFGIWELSLLYCIPLYVFVFAIYYAVSALAGVIWRNPLICIALSVLFWLVCFTMGAIKSGYESFALDTARFTKLIEAEGEVFAINGAGVTKRWDEKRKIWDEVFVSDSQRAMQVMVALMPEVPAELKPLGPVYDAENDRLVNVIRDMQAGAKLVTLVGERNTQWKPKEGAPPPSGLISLKSSPSGDILAVTSYGLYVARGDIAKKPEKGKPLLGMIPLPNMSKGPFRKVGPEKGLILTRPAAAAVDQVNSRLVVYTRGKLTVLERKDDGDYELRLEKEIEGLDAKPVKLATTGGQLLLGKADGELQLYDEELDLKKSFMPESRAAVEAISASSDGETFAVTFNNGRLWLVDATTQEATQAPVTGQGSISATLFTKQGTLLATHQSVRVNEYDLESGRRLKSYSPPMDPMEIAYRYVIYPLYIIFPKPSELNRTIDYTLANEEKAKQIEDPLQPVYSSAAFIVGVLLLCFIYIERQEF